MSAAPDFYYRLALLQETLELYWLFIKYTIFGYTEEQRVEYSRRLSYLEELRK